MRFRNVPVVRLGDGPSAQPGVTVDVAFGGAFYASVEERVEPGELPRLIELGRELKRELEACARGRPPARAGARDIYGVIFWQAEGERPPTQRNVTVFADGEVDRSPCGTDLGALALLDAAGELPRGMKLRHRQHRRYGVPRPGRGRPDVAGGPP